MNGWTALCYLGTLGLGLYLWNQDRKEWIAAILEQQDIIAGLEDENFDLRNLSDQEKAAPWN